MVKVEKKNGLMSGRRVPSLKVGIKIKRNNHVVARSRQ